MSAAPDAPTPAPDAPAPAPVAPAPRPTLALLGDPTAAACDGDACALPAGK
ncbi:hypothetical protein ABH923_000244 [Leifsonia sp. EB41]|uniref:hypothetical protein n=1 Tax=Leifsonia sp. EB41 TaxID=3156260 RepID=UPI003510E9F1